VATLAMFRVMVGQVGEGQVAKFRGMVWLSRRNMGGLLYRDGWLSR
jgi:hypothetical protein